jgi:hypothetical protein
MIFAGGVRLRIYPLRVSATDSDLSFRGAFISSSTGNNADMRLMSSGTAPGQSGSKPSFTCLFSLNLALVLRKTPGEPSCQGRVGRGLRELSAHAAGGLLSGCH